MHCYFLAHFLFLRKNFESQQLHSLLFYSSQIMTPIPPVSSPPLTSKMKEPADNENLDVSEVFYIAVVMFEVF